MSPDLAAATGPRRTFLLAVIFFGRQASPVAQWLGVGWRRNDPHRGHNLCCGKVHPTSGRRELCEGDRC